MTVDFHNHYFPPAFLEAVRRGPSAFRITDDDAGNPILHSPGDYNVVVPGHRDLEARIADLDAAGVDRQVITFTAPGTSIETPERAVELARLVNDELAAAADRHDRFTALGHLPMNAPEAAVDELDRCVTELGMPGVMPFGNASGVPLADARFEPLWARADALGAVVYIHPTYPVGVEAMERFMLMPLVGFMFDTTLAAAHLVYAGVPDRYPGIRWVLAHLGGAIPYLAERLDRGYEAFPTCRERLDRPPSEVLKGFWYDTVNFDPAALRLALDFAGPDRIVAGSDYPHMIGSLDRMVASLEALDIDDADRRKIMAENAAALLGL
jgi:aminocarboxymuconate-semialdehyde decarboxylase